MSCCPVEFGVKHVRWYGQCFIVDSSRLACSEQESAGCHPGTLEEKFFMGQKENGHRVPLPSIPNSPYLPY